jgi:hypothetical protein
MESPNLTEPVNDSVIHPECSILDASPTFYNFGSKSSEMSHGKQIEIYKTLWLRLKGFSVDIQL